MEMKVEWQDSPASWTISAVNAASRPIKILFVCLGNICRSPTAQGVFLHYVREAGLEKEIVIDSAGTGDYQIGCPPDPRACSAAAQRGYDVSGHVARQVTREDFAEFDYVLAMDEENLRTLKRLCPAEHARKVRLFTEFSSKGAAGVPDPYIGGPEGFELVLDLVEDSARGLLLHVRR
jgi:protein-tyrosine phosphatase